jgi:hypothetical protein
MIRVATRSEMGALSFVPVVVPSHVPAIGGKGEAVGVAGSAGGMSITPGVPVIRGTGKGVGVAVFTDGMRSTPVVTSTTTAGINATKSGMVTFSTHHCQVLGVLLLFFFLFAGIFFSCRDEICSYHYKDHPITRKGRMSGVLGGDWQVVTGALFLDKG